MRTEEKPSSTFLEISKQLRYHAWDITEAWLDERKLVLTREELHDRERSGGSLNELPTLIGGVGKVVHDQTYLVDLEPGGGLFAVAQEFGRSRHKAGNKIDRLLSDFSLLRKKLRVFCEQLNKADNQSLFESERRLNLAVDLIMTAAVGAFYQRSSAEFIELSRKDKLTGFLNLSAFNRLLDDELTRSKRYRYPVAFTRIDIDGFTQFNDEEGRSGGDRLLRDIAREIMRIARRTDFIARFGGDEFAILMPQTDAEQARIGAERLRRRIRQIRREERLITVSIGVVSFPDIADNKFGLIEKAGEVMCRARNDGGDVVKTKMS